MKKTFKILFIISLVTLSTKVINSQPCDLKPDEIPGYKNQTLIVESQSETLNNWFSEFWTFNTKIEFKTEEEILKIPDTKIDKYLVLGTFIEKMHYNDYQGKRQEASSYLKMLGIVNLKDYKSTKKRNRVDNAIVSIYTPYNEYLKDYNLRPFEFKITVKIMANLLKAIEKQQIKKYKATKFAKDQADLNCEKISTKEIFFDKVLLKNIADINELKKNKKFIVNLSDAEQIAEKVDNDEDILFPYSAPFGIQGENEVLVYIHYLVNAKTGEIYYESGMSQFTLPGPYFGKKIFKEILDCLNQ